MGRAAEPATFSGGLLGASGESVVLQDETAPASRARAVKWAKNRGQGRGNLSMRRRIGTLKNGTIRHRPRYGNPESAEIGCRPVRLGDCWRVS
jgi:hypothetical protein